MTALIDRIQADATALAACESGQFDAAAERLNAIAQPTRKPESVARKTWVGLQDHFELDRVTGWKATILGAIEAAKSAGNQVMAAKLILFDTSLGSPGYDFGNPKSQQQLGELGQAGLLTSQDVADLRAVGMMTVNVSADQCETSWQAYQARQTELVLAARRSAIIAALGHARELVGDELPTLEAVVSVITANWPQGGE